MSTLMPDLHPDTGRVRALITTKWGKSGYRPIVVTRLERYFIDTSLDADADSWQIEIGDPNGDYLELLARDNEVRAQLYGVGRQGSNPIMTGIADEVTYDEEGTLTITGRDLSSLATDSIVPPQQFRAVRPWSIVERQAKEIGFKQTNLARRGIVKKLNTTDGSETYWEFWYRMYRKEKMWLWTEPNGMLTANRLSYDAGASYFFGTPRRTDSARIRELYIPVERCEIRKSTQQRVGELWVYGHKGDNGIFSSPIFDPTTRGWMKRPRRILLDTEAHTTKALLKLAWEEIFEGKVGSREIRITIPDPGFPIRQNRIAVLHVPEIGFGGEFFVVGARLQGGTDGFIQEVRLREKQYALSRRTPKDPKIIDKTPRSTDVATELGLAIAALANMPEEWGAYFVRAAKKWAGQGVWDFNLFLAVLIAICTVETDFRNIRANGGPGGDGVLWYPWSPVAGGTENLPSGGRAPKTGTRDTNGRSREEWEELFANEPGTYTRDATYAVGPMQLWSLKYKNWADDELELGNRDQFKGGRWHPKHNIWAAARALREKLQFDNKDSGRDIDMWGGVSLYGHNAKDYTKGHPTPYALKVKNMVYNDPAYLQSVQDAVVAAREAADAAKDGDTDAAQPSDDTPKALPNVNQALAMFSTPLSVTEFTRRDLIVAAAMFGYYNRDLMHYSQGPMRMQDFDPPPNVPGWTDCSGFATWCYKCAGVADPNGNNYNGKGYTGDLWDNGRAISAAQLRPGDLVFYGTSPHSRAGHVSVYVGFGKVVSFGLEIGPLLYGITTGRSDVYGFATYIGEPKTAGGAAAPVVRSIVIQAGHDTGTHSDQPYGHEGESGATGEASFNASVRDALFTLLNADNRFRPSRATAWSASAGASASPGDDENSKSDIFIAIHAYRDAGLSGYFFGWPTDRGDPVENASMHLRDAIINRMNLFSGHPARNAAKDQQGPTYYGYYAWGHSSRGFPNNIDHTAGTKARLLIECGHLVDDGITTHVSDIATALYRGICDYYDITPL